MHVADEYKGLFPHGNILNLNKDCYLLYITIILHFKSEYTSYKSCVSE